MMRWVRLVPVVGAVAVLAVGAVGFERYIPIHHVERARLSDLVVPKAGTGFIAKPASADEVPATSSPFAALTAAAKRSPNSTGAYAVQWTAPKPSTNVASVLVSMLPSASEAAAVDTQATKLYLTATSFKSDNFTLKSPFPVPGISGARAAMFTPTSDKGTQRLGVTVFRVGRFVVADFVQGTGAGPAQTAATALDQAEAAQLRHDGSGFSLVVTTWPTVASLVYGAIVVVIAALIVLVPLGYRRARVRRRLAHEAAARRAIQSRGKKIAKRQASRPVSRRR